MVIFYDIVKFIFFLLTLMVGVFYLRGQQVIEGQAYHVIFQGLMPGYLLFCGLMIGYLVAHIWEQNRDPQTQVRAIYIKSFIIGIILWLTLAFTYMFVG